MKYVFFGTSDFAVTILERLIQAGFIPSAIVTNPDRPVGRKHILTPPPVKRWLRDNTPLFKDQISVFQPIKLGEVKKDLEDLKPDLFIVAAYGKIIPKSILEIPKHGSINVHPSLLPLHRGPTPIQTALLHGDKETGVSIMLLDEAMDHGPILKNQKSKIKNQNYGELSKELADLGAELLIEVIPEWMDGKIVPVPQDDEKATYTRIYKGENGLLDFSKSVEELDHQIRALNPEPGTYFMKDGKRIKVLKAHIDDGKLIAEIIQSDGKKPMQYGKTIEVQPQ